MRERTETGIDLFPVSNDVVFTVSEAAEKGKTPKGKYYYIFRFSAALNGRRRKYSEVMMVWMSGPMLRALQCNEIEKDVFDWDKEEIVGRQIVADVIHEPNFKDPTKMASRLKNIRPFSDAMSEPTPVAAGVGAKTDEEIPF